VASIELISLCENLALLNRGTLYFVGRNFLTGMYILAVEKYIAVRRTGRAGRFWGIVKTYRYSLKNSSEQDILLKSLIQESIQQGALIG
tara:strand:+ start:127 stop:393 length:267 start_codon:yes stop_codon:yes gene_type:complete